MATRQPQTETPASESPGLLAVRKPSVVESELGAPTSEDTGNVSTSDSCGSSNSTSSNTSVTFSNLAQSWETVITELDNSNSPSLNPLRISALQTSIPDRWKTLEEGMQDLLKTIRKSQDLGLQNNCDLDCFTVQNVHPCVVAALLENEALSDIRFSFDSRSKILLVPMPSEVHDSAHYWFEHSFFPSLCAALGTHGLSAKTRGTRRCEVHIQNWSLVYEPDFSIEIYDPSLKNRPVCPQPESGSIHVAEGILNLGSCSKPKPSHEEIISRRKEARRLKSLRLGFPSIVVEVAYTQTVADARRKACDWLHGSNGHVQAVFLLNIVRPSDKINRLEPSWYSAYLEIWTRVSDMSAESVLADTGTRTIFKYDGMAIEAIYQDETNDLINPQSIDHTISLRLEDLVPQQFRQLVAGSVLTFGTYPLHEELLDGIDLWIDKNDKSVLSEEE